MSNLLAGNQVGSAYRGTSANQPPNWNFERRDPTQFDTLNYALGDLWLNSTNQTVWVLVSLAGDANSKGEKALWVMFGGTGGDLRSLTGNNPVTVFGDANENINVIGDVTYITIQGNAGTNTLTASLVNGGLFANNFPTDFQSPAIPAANILQVKGGASLDAEQVALTYRKNIHTAANPMNSNLLEVKLNDSISLPDTNAAGTAGIIYFGGAAIGNRFISNYGTSNTFIGEASGNNTLTTGSAQGSTCVGFNTGSNLSTARGSTFIGRLAGNACTTGIDNVFVGDQCGLVFTTGAADAGANTCVGTLCARSMTSGVQNVMIGDSAGLNILSGSQNTLIGGGGGGATGINYTGAESSNILIMNQGVMGESNIIRIGASGGGTGQQNKCFIAGIRGITTGVADAIAVLIDSAGQLGTISSSIRFKENIEDMGHHSCHILDLNPVTFKYINQQSDRKQVGLIAEEVLEVMPDLVVYNKDGEVESVRYHDLVPMLLNELQKLEKRVKLLEQS